jgi:HlyD family secretion protein
MKNILARNGRNGKGKTDQASDQASRLSPGEDTDQEQSPPPAGRLVRTDAFDQPVILQQTSIWSRGIALGIIGITTFAIVWSMVARIEQAVPATGKLAPEARVQEVQAPVGGVVDEILVEDGQRVKKDELLVRFDPRATQAQLRSLAQVRDSLSQENQFYRAQMLGAEISPEQAAELDLPPEMLALTANRSALIDENRLYQAQLAGEPTANLTLDQLARLRSGIAEADSRSAAARMEVAQLQQQLSQTQGQLRAAQQSLAIDEEILGDVRPLAEEGGIARLQLRRQEQEVLNGQAEVDRLTQEEQRIRFQIAKAEEELQNTLAVTSNDLLTRIADNNERIAEIDSQLNKAIVENQKQIAEIESQLRQAEVTLQYQELRAPIDGIVFDIQAKGPGFVANTSEPILKIVPGQGLVAEVYITNQDIGFVDEGMPVDVRIDSFPFSEFGDVKGTVKNIGSDALPPDEIYNYYRFPTAIELDSQYIEVKGKQVPLQSGMSVTANIITRDRTVFSIFTDLFTGKFDTLRTVR